MTVGKVVEIEVFFYPVMPDGCSLVTFNLDKEIPGLIVHEDQVKEPPVKNFHERSSRYIPRGGAAILEYCQETTINIFSRTGNIIAFVIFQYITNSLYLVKLFYPFLGGKG